MEAVVTTTSEIGKPAATFREIREFMKRPALENELGLPLPLVRAIEHDTYNRGDSDFTTTELLTPPRVLELRRRNSDKIVQDASDLIFSLFGRVMHTILEKAADEQYIVEKRYSIEFEGAKISGQIDLYDTHLKVLQDWKITSRWVAIDGPKEEWVAQQNINRYLLWKNGIEVKKLENVLIYRDWSKIQAAMKSDYPQRQVEIVPIPLWDRPKVEGYLSERIAMHRAARSGELPFCTPVERWTRPTRWALMKKGQKRAIKLFDTEDEANGAVKDGQYVEERPGEDQRCIHYCDCLPFCAQGRELVQLHSE